MFFQVVLVALKIAETSENIMLSFFKNYNNSFVSKFCENQRLLESIRDILLLTTCLKTRKERISLSLFTL